MRHAFTYHGGLEANLPKLQPGAKKFQGTDGEMHDLPAVPASAYLHIGYMEKMGKKFCAVRVQDKDDDVVVTNEIVIEPGRHMGFGARFGPEPLLIEDDTVVMTLLEDLIKKNDKQAPQLLKIRDRLKKAIKR